jgi:hypothetical protein
MPLPSLLRDPEPIAPPDYPILAGEFVLRPLDPTEWNMERLNRVSNGAGCVYQIVRGRGPLTEGRLREAVEGLTRRHAMLGARIVRERDEGDAPLLYLRGGAPQVAFVDAAGLDDRYLEIVEADMNAGPSPCWRASPFRFACLADAACPQRWVLVLAGPHAHCDGISLAWLAHELLEAIATGKVGAPLPIRSIEIDPLLEREVKAPEPASVRYVAPEAEVPAEPSRRALVRTGLTQARLTPELTRALVHAVKRNGLTVHGAIGAAVHLALATRHAAVTGESPYGVYRAGSPVSMRPHVDPPLADADIRMAVDVALTDTAVGADDGFWSLARRFGAAVHEQIRTGDILRSWNRTTKKDREVGSTGVPIPLISNVGRSALQPGYGPLAVEDVAGAMATHGMFQIDMLFTTFDGQLGGCFYFESPTVSRASMTRFVRRTMDILASPEVHEGEPSIAALLGVID